MSKTKFVVPNAFTSISFLLAVWSPLIVSGVINVEKPLWLAANFILFCVLLDKLDGFAARLLNASSEFGAQLDSMADLIAFGVAPGFLLVFGFKYNNLSWYLDNQIKVMVVASVFMLCAALRLAKYNALDGDEHPNHFVGMPSTLAGAFCALFVILSEKYGLFATMPQYILISFAVLGFLMVSPFFLPKLSPRKNKVFHYFQIVIVLSAYVCGFAMIYHEYLLIITASYAIFGFLIALTHKSEAS